MIVADLLADAALQLRLHTPSSPGRLERRISWCAPTEILDPTPLLTPNVLLCTNGVGMNIEEDRTWSAYVERLASVPVAAIAFGTGVAHHLIPPGLVKAAINFDVPLLEIPHSVSFLQVHRHLTNVLQAEHFTVRTRSWELADACSRHAATTSSVRSMLGEVGKAVGGPVAIVDGGGSVIAQSPGTSRWTNEDLRRAATNGDDDRSVPLPMGGGDSFQLVVHRSARDEPLSALLAPAASIIAVQLRSALQTASYRQPELQSLLSQAADWQGIGWQEFARTFRSTGLDEKRPTLAVVAALAEDGPANVWKIRLMLQDAFEELRVIVLDGAVVALAQGPTPDLLQAASGGSMASFLTENFRSLARNQAVVLKGPCESLDELRLGICAATELIHHVTEPVTAPELSIDALLAAAAGHGALGGARKLLSPIVAHDRKHSGHLLDTLKTYLDSDCQPSRACEKLFIHRNTLAQRLRKLESLLRLRLDTLEGQMTCLMAVRLTEGRGARPKVEAKTGVQPPASN